jgi:hypothetical protein
LHALRPISAFAIPLLVCTLACGVPEGDERAGTPDRQPGGRPEAGMAMPPETAEPSMREAGRMSGGAEPALDDARLLLESEDAALREAGVYALEPNGVGLEALLLLTQSDPNAAVRRAAVNRIADAEGPAVTDALVRALRDADSGVVEEAVVALSFRMDPRAIPALEEIRSHADPDVRLAVEDALVLLGE